MNIPKTETIVPDVKTPESHKNSLTKKLAAPLVAAAVLIGAAVAPAEKVEGQDAEQVQEVDPNSDSQPGVIRNSMDEEMVLQKGVPEAGSAEEGQEEEEAPQEGGDDEVSELEELDTDGDGVNDVRGIDTDGDGKLEEGGPINQQNEYGISDAPLVVDAPKSGGEDEYGISDAPLVVDAPVGGDSN